MTASSIFSKLSRQSDGSWTAAYGPFVLQSALQPIFSQDADGHFEVQAFEGLIRPNKGGDPVRPAEFFPAVARDDKGMIDSLCRTLHIFNTAALARKRAKLFVNFHPGLFVTAADIRREVELMRLAANESGLTPARIACEITQKENDSADMLALFVEELRARGFLIAIDEYGADERDAARMKLLKPDFVKFEASWVKEFLENSAGYALLGVMVRQIKEQGAVPIFEGLEDLRQADLCQNLEVPLLQGYALARPEIAPTSFNDEFPEAVEDGSRYDTRPAQELERYDPALHMPKSIYSAPPQMGGLRRAATFGKRTR